MLFNSFVFVVFFILVYTAYLFLLRFHRAQNLLLLVASYVFYGYWDWRFLSLLAFSTLVDFFAAQYIERSKTLPRRKFILAVSLIIHLSILSFFKYFNFFADSFVRLFATFGLVLDDVTLNIVLPVGISFYTFQSMGYVIDVYRGRMTPARNLLDYALFVSFFPQLVAGPIERAKSLLPQIASPRKVSWAQIDAGLYLILWGYFKKVVIADNMAFIADPIFNQYSQYQGLDLLIGVLAFSVQIYGDFSGYSDIARGLGKLMGIELMMNFKLPYFAMNPGDFWSRWHVSLSTWLRDYLYIPLGGNRKGTSNTYRNLGITMLLGGLWHGAAWNFVLWGAYHGFLLIGHRIISRRFGQIVRNSSPIVLAKMILMSALVILGWIFFRSESTGQMIYIFGHLGLSISPQTSRLAFDFFFLLIPLLIFEIYQQKTRDLLAVTKLPTGWRALVYVFLMIWIMIFGVRESIEFIYFQF